MLTTQEALTDVELSELTRHESVIERGLKTFVDVGLALTAIRDARLYRETYATFEDYCRERWNFEKSRVNQLMGASKVIANLKTSTIVEVYPANEAQARPLTSLTPEEQRQAWAWAVETAPDGKITGAHVQSVVDEMRGKVETDEWDEYEFDYQQTDAANAAGFAVAYPPEPKSRPHVANNSGNNEWYTPPEYIEAARRVMGWIDLDPASSQIANRTVCAGKFFTAEDDGLTKQWAGRVWMNPPYAAGLVDKFARKLSEEYAAGSVDEAIVLVNNATETGWFSDLVSQSSAVVFPRSRVKFYGPNGATGAPLQGQAILYFGHRPDQFLSEYSSFGWGAKTWH